MIIAAIFLAAAVAVTAAVIAASRLDGKGRHKHRPSRSHRAGQAARAAEDFIGQLRGHLGAPGCLPLDTALLEPGPHGWDFGVQLRPGSPPPAPHDTGEMPAALARGDITPAEIADHLAGKYLSAPEVTP